MASNNSSENTLSVDAEKDKEFKSGETSPEEGRSVFSGRQRSNTETTLVSSVADDSRSISTTTQPDVPVNSPISGSIAGDAGVSATEVIDRVKTLTPDDGIVQAGEQDGKGGLKETVKRDGVSESSFWGNEAVESAGIGLKRLIQLAKDEHVVDPSKSVAQYYSEHLAKVIRDAEVDFDAMKLQ